MITAEARIRGTAFADTGAELEAGTPTMLAGLEVSWGRETTVDQPAAATARATVLDRSGGTGFGELVEVGDPLEVWASGDVSTGSEVDVAVDGGFEALPLGPAGLRVYVDVSTTATVTADRPAAGVHALAVAAPWFTPSTMWLPPAAFDPADPTAWDAIPRFALGDVWRWSIAVRVAIGGRLQITPTTFTGPNDLQGVGGRAGADVYIDGDGTWSVATGTTDAATAGDDRWLGLYLMARYWDSWAERPDTWAAAPGTWADYTGYSADELELWSPPTDLIRNVLVFSGRVTDLAATIDPDGAFRVAVTAVDQLADLENVWIGVEPWPAETVAARFSRIIAAGGVPVTTRLDAPLDALTVSKRDVDNQPEGSLLGELAAGIDGVLWSATHATLGAFLWLEDMASRAQVGALELVGGEVVIVPAAGHRPAGTTTLDGCRIPLTGVTFTRDVSDLINAVDATWSEQTTPNVTEHTIHVGATGAGVRRMGVNTQLTTAQAATDVANRILARTDEIRWRVDGLDYDLDRYPPAGGAETVDALDLLDGTIRLGRGLVVTNVAYWPESALGLYLEGGRYRFDGGWFLELTASPMGGMGVSAPWNTLDPAWSWAMFDPDIEWADLYGVAA